MGGIKKPDNIDYDNLRGFEKAAILVNYLGEKATKALFSNLEDTDIRKLLGVMARLRVIPVAVTKKVRNHSCQIDDRCNHRFRYS